jgi:hypothetical protein
MLAVTSTVPGEMPVAVPLVSMLATPEKLLDQLKTALAMLLPFASLAVAVKCCCSPILMVTLVGAIDTEPTVGNTVRLTAGLVTPLFDAVIWVVPPFFPVAMPEVSIVATLVSLLAHVNVTVPTLFPVEFNALAVKAWCPFTVVELTDGITTILLTVVEELLDPPQDVITNVIAIAAAQVSKEAIFRWAVISSVLPLHKSTESTFTVGLQHQQIVVVHYVSDIAGLIAARL